MWRLGRQRVPDFTVMRRRRMLSVMRDIICRTVVRTGMVVR